MVPHTHNKMTHPLDNNIAMAMAVVAVLVALPLGHAFIFSGKNPLKIVQ